MHSNRLIVAVVSVALAFVLPAFAQEKKPSKSKAFDEVQPEKESKGEKKPTTAKRIEPEAAKPKRDPHSFKGGYLRGDFSSLKVLRSGDVEVTVDITSTARNGFSGGINLVQRANGHTNTPMEEHWANTELKLTTANGDELAPIGAEGITFNNANIRQSRVLGISVDQPTPVTFRFRPTGGAKVTAEDSFTLTGSIQNPVYQPNFSIPSEKAVVSIRLEDLKGKK